MSEMFASSATSPGGDGRILSGLESSVTLGRPTLDPRVARPVELNEIGERSALDPPFAPLMDIASIVALANPQLGAFAARLGLALRAVAEQELRRAIPSIRRTLETGFLENVADRVCEGLVARHLPVGPDGLLADVLAGYNENLEAGWLRADAPAASLVCGLIADFEHGLAGGTSPAGRRFWSGGRMEDVPDNLRGEEVAEETEEGVSPYVMVASVTPPRLVRRRTASAGDLADFSGQLVEEPFALDRPRVVEVTYLGDTNVAYAIDELPGGRRVPLRGLPQYRPDIQADLPDNYADNVDPTLNVKVFTVQFRLEGVLAGIPLIGTELQELLDDNRDRIKEEIEDLAERAGDAAKAAVEGKGLPFGDLAGDVVEQSMKTLSAKVFELLSDALGSKKSPTWQLVHYVLYQPPALPESVFRLFSSSGRAELYAIKRDPQGPGTDTVELVQDIRGRPLYPLFKKEQVAFYRQARRMIGPSTEPAVTVPPGLWDLVGATTQAAEWASAEQNEGFHVLVSTLPAVLAIRADVRRRPARL
jgi:hypothetical protein